MIKVLLKRLLVLVVLFTSLFGNLVSVSAFDFVAPTPQIKELFNGHNDTSVRRVNLVFVFLDSYYNENNLEQSIRNLKDSLTFNGEPIRITNEQGETVDLKYGMFSIEPLRSYRNKFNLWVYDGVYEEDKDLPTEISLMDSVIPIFLGGSQTDDLFSFAYIAGSANSLFEQENSQLGIKVAVIDLVKPRQDELITFPSIYFNYPLKTILNKKIINTFTHELGHALFGMMDEYVEAPFLVEGYNCTPNQQKAEQTWGDLVGQSDPFLEKIENDYKTLVIGENQNIRIDYEARRIQLEATGCTGNQMYVPASTSIMRSDTEIPAFNPVERRRIDEVMAVFESSPKEGYSNLPILEQSQKIEKESVAEYKKWRNKFDDVEEIEENAEQSQFISEKIDDNVADYNWFWLVGFGVLVLVVLIVIVVFTVFKK